MRLGILRKFEKISFNQYAADRLKQEQIDDDMLRAEWENIKLPTAATSGSAGYDFYLPVGVSFGATPSIIQTGIRFVTDEPVFLLLAPRSGLGFKYGMRLSNTIGIVDSDYWQALNEGHIATKVVSDVSFSLGRGERFIQGIIMPYMLADNGNSEDARIGGFGSTGTN